jgi:hypothetical protein
VNDPAALPSATPTEILKPDPQIWRAMMDAALRVHRFHTAKVEGGDAQRAEPRRIDDHRARPGQEA